MFNIIIIGGENAPSYESFQKKCIQLLRSKAESGERIRILTIGDEYVDTFSSKFGIETKKYNCDWIKNGKTALFSRNKEIVSDANAILYFDSGKNDLTNLYEYAKKRKLDARRVNVEKLKTT